MPKKYMITEEGLCGSSGVIKVQHENIFVDSLRLLHIFIWGVNKKPFWEV